MALNTLQCKHFLGTLLAQYYHSTGDEHKNPCLRHLFPTTVKFTQQNYHDRHKYCPKSGGQCIRSVNIAYEYATYLYQCKLPMLACYSQESQQEMEAKCGGSRLSSQLSGVWSKKFLSHIQASLGYIANSRPAQVYCEALSQRTKESRGRVLNTQKKLISLYHICQTLFKYKESTLA